MELGKLGVWVSMDGMTAAAAAAFAKRVEEWGYAALWIPESRGRNALVHSSWLLANTQKLIVATGHRQHLRPRPDGDGERPARPHRAVGRPLSARRRRVASADGARAARPHLRQAGRDDARLSAKRCATAPYQAPMPPREAADDRRGAGAADDGAVGRARRRRAPVQHDAGAYRARRARSSAPASCCARRSGCCWRPTRPTARRAAREALSRYMQLDNYVNSWRREGFGDDDLAGGGSDRFLDANGRVGRRGRDPRAHPGALGRRRRPCLHPVDQPRRLAAGRRRENSRPAGARRARS